MLTNLCIFPWYCFAFAYIIDNDAPRNGLPPISVLANTTLMTLRQSFGWFYNQESFLSSQENTIQYIQFFSGYCTITTGAMDTHVSWNIRVFTSVSGIICAVIALKTIKFLGLPSAWQILHWTGLDNWACWYHLTHWPLRPWWRHKMETFSALLAICAGNSPGTGDFPAQRPVTRSFDVFFDLRLNKRLSKQWWGWWFETPSPPLCRHPNDTWRWSLIKTYKHIVWVVLLNRCEIALWWIPLDHSDFKSILVQIMAWCRQASSLYLNLWCSKLTTRCCEITG